MKIKKIKKITLLLFKGLSAFCFSYVVTLIGQELISYGMFSFVFLLISVGLAFFYLVKNYGFLGVFLVDLFLVLLAFLLRFYVIIAYGS